MYIFPIRGSIQNRLYSWSSTCAKYFLLEFLFINLKLLTNVFYNSHFNTLPEEIASYIFSYLGYKNVCLLAQVSLKFHQCAHQELLWLDLYQRRWFNNPIDDLWLKTKRVHPEKLFMMRRRIEIAYLNSADAKCVETNSKVSIIFDIFQSWSVSISLFDRH